MAKRPNRQQQQTQADQVPAPEPGNEIAVAWGERDPTRGFLRPDGTLYNEDVVLQLTLGGDLRQYEDLLRDDQVAATFEQRRCAVTASEWTVEAGADDAASKAAADHLTEQLHHVGFDEITDKMLYARFFGWSVAELLWKVCDNGLLGWSSVKVRDRKRFLFTADGRSYLDTGVVDPANRIYAEPPYFWIVQAGADHSDNPYGRGLAHQLYWPVRFKRDGIRFWLVYLEKFAMPTAVGKFKQGKDAISRQNLLSAIKAIQTQAGVIIPDDMVIELLEASRTGSVDYGAMQARMDAAISKIIVGQTLTTEVGSNGGNRALGQVHNSVRMDLVKADADLVCESFNNGPARWLTAVNFRGATPPRVKRATEEGTDLGALVAQLVQLDSIGFRPTLEMIRANWGGDIEAKPEPKLPPAMARAAGLPGAAGNQPAAADDEADDSQQEAAFAAVVAAAFPDQVVLDEALDENMARIARMSNATLRPLLEYASTHTPSEMLDAMASALPGWDPDALTEALARVLFISRTLGRANGAAN